MARWWTRPPIMIAVLGVVAVMITVLLRTTITYHTSGAGSGEQAFQEALTMYRQLAQAQPQAYLPQVAMTLQNLGMLKVDQEDVSQAQTLITEALTIRRALWQNRAEASGNDLAQSLAVESMLPPKQEEAMRLICEHMHAMAKVARRENLKQWARERAAKVCKRR